MNKEKCFTLEKAAFTLAEVLITLAVIGVVAAMTIPTLISRYQKHETLNKFKKAYSTLANAVALSNANDFTLYSLSGKEVSSELTQDFLNNNWFRYFNSPVITPDGTQAYELERPYKDQKGNIQDWAIKTDYPHARVYYKTRDGIGYFMVFMTWNSDYTVATYSEKMTVYTDLNGIKEPNILGKDVFVFDIDLINNKVTPQCSNNRTYAQINGNCSEKGIGNCCGTKIIRDGWKIAEDYPW